MSDQTYKRLEFAEYGNPLTVLHFKTITGIPSPKEDEVVIKVSASPVHPSVLLFVSGKICLQYSTLLLALFMPLSSSYNQN